MTFKSCSYLFLEYLVTLNVSYFVWCLWLSAQVIFLVDIVKRYWNCITALNVFYSVNYWIFNSDPCYHIYFCLTYSINLSLGSQNVFHCLLLCPMLVCFQYMSMVTLVFKLKVTPPPHSFAPSIVSSLENSLTFFKFAQT